MDRQRFYLGGTVHLLKRLFCLVPFAFVAVGCDVATNQTGGGWLASQQGIAPPNMVVLDVDVPWSSHLQEFSASPSFQVGRWQGSEASSILWIPLNDSLAGLSKDTLPWSRLEFKLMASALPTRTDPVQVVREFLLGSDSAGIATWFSASNPVFSSPILRDTLTFDLKDTLWSDTLSGALVDSLSALRDVSGARRGVLVRLSPLASSKDGIVQLKSARLHATSADTVNYTMEAAPGGLAYRGFLVSPMLKPANPLVQGGPVDWVLRLFPDTAALRRSIAAALVARGYANDLRSVSVLDARLSFDAEYLRSDSVGQRLRLFSAIGDSTDLSRTLRGDSAQSFDSVSVRISRDTIGDSIEVQLVTQGGSRDSLNLRVQDTLPVSRSFGGIRWVFQRTGDSVAASAKGIGAGLVDESQKNRENAYNAGSYLGSTQTLSARRAFAGLLNWPDGQPEILLRGISSDASQWWQMRPKLATAKVHLTLLPLGGAK